MIFRSNNLEEIKRMLIHQRSIISDIPLWISHLEDIDKIAENNKVSLRYVIIITGSMKARREMDYLIQIIQTSRGQVTESFDKNFYCLPCFPLRLMI